MRLKFSFLFIIAFNFHFYVKSQYIDFSKSSIIISDKIKPEIKETALKILQEEVFKRSNLKLGVAQKNPILPIITIALSNEVGFLGQRPPQFSLIENLKEGFLVKQEKINNQDVLWLVGNNSRGVLYAIGQFLKTASFTNKKISIKKDYRFESAPKYSIRGHQLGYRNTANSWDAWTVQQYEQYIRELVLFGANCIENIPLQDDKQSPHMKVSRGEMNNKLSEICHNYGIDYWVWTPIEDISTNEKFEKEIARHSNFYKTCPYLDALFFPCGDPGDNDIKNVLPFLQKLSENLKNYHPKATIWVSLQGLNDSQVDYFYDYLAKNNPDWLAGVVTGPSSPDLAETRYRLPTKYLHRHYPDITHTVRCQYPTENWDQAFALTQGREVTNPRPYYSAKIHNRFAPFTDGFLAYSDGVHDDINKTIWSQLAWDPTKNVNEILMEYSHFFFGPNIAADAANGILALERNWVGPVEENGGIETTFEFWKNLELKNPQLATNWRWQLLVLRAYYDTWVKRRKIFEQNLEKKANLILQNSKNIGADKAMEQALNIVNKPDYEPFEPDLKKKITEYCEALFKSIGLQTSVKKYQASGAERGAILDFIDYPLNNRWWLADEFEKIKKLSIEKEKLDRLAVIYSWENPGEGSYYDNISDISKGPRVLTHSDDATDVAWWENGMSRRRLSTQLFQNFPKLAYQDLDPAAHYTIRIAGYGEALLRVDGQRIEPNIYNKGLEEFKEFHLNKNLYSSGKIEVSFDQPEESHLNWRQQSKICDIWLLKNK